MCLSDKEYDWMSGNRNYQSKKTVKNVHFGGLKRKNAAKITFFATI